MLTLQGYYLLYYRRTYVMLGTLTDNPPKSRVHVHIIAYIIIYKYKLPTAGSINS